MIGQVQCVRANGQHVWIFHPREVFHHVVDGLVNRVPVDRRGLLVLQERDQRVSGERQPFGRSALHVAVADVAHLRETTVVSLIVGQPL